MAIPRLDVSYNSTTHRLGDTNEDVWCDTGVKGWVKSVWGSSFKALDSSGQTVYVNYASLKHRVKNNNIESLKPAVDVILKNPDLDFVAENLGSNKALFSQWAKDQFDNFVTSNDGHTRLFDKLDVSNRITISRASRVDPSGLDWKGVYDDYFKDKDMNTVLNDPKLLSIIEFIISPANSGISSESKYLIFKDFSERSGLYEKAKDTPIASGLWKRLLTISPINTALAPFKPQPTLISRYDSQLESIRNAKNSIDDTAFQNLMRLAGFAYQDIHYNEHIHEMDRIDDVDKICSFLLQSELINRPQRNDGMAN